MNIFSHRKIIFIFVLAIFLPLLIVGYLSISTFAKRREAIKKLLESNLWISGEAAINSIEASLLEREKSVLRSENYIRLIQSEEITRPIYSSQVFSGDVPGQLFLLDAGYKKIFPETFSENTLVIQWEKETSNSQFAQLFKRAESFEFSEKNYARAAELYEECTRSTLSEQYCAIALERLGRCLLSSNNYDEAEKAYNELSGKYSQVRNKAGHPYGIISIFQLFDIALKKNREEKSLGLLFDLYRKIREGIWQIPLPVYDYYVSEIESILDSRLNNGKFPDIQKSFTELQKQQSAYRQELIFADFLESVAIPKLKEKLTSLPAANEIGSSRLPITLDNEFFLVSYTILSNFRPGQTFYGGFLWNLNLLKNQILQEVSGKMTEETGLDFKIVDEKGQNVTTGLNESSTKESLILPFRIFPLPWKLIVYQPELKAVENTAQREIFFYGVLLTFVVLLMLLGAVLIARDISRESETTRLKTEFVNNISHELKTPLTLIRLYGETLQRKENLTNEEKKNCYEIITKESERLSHLINNVLDFSRIEMGRKEFDIKKGDLAEVIGDTLESYRYHLEKKGFIISKDIAMDLPGMNFDGEAIASILINLLGNAMKFSQKEKEVTVKLFRDDGNVILQVADKGIGIPQKEIPKIFQRFYQSENKIASETKGSGLGLTLVKHIAEAHNGTVRVESEPGKGSIFSVVLPVTDTEKDKKHE